MHHPIRCRLDTCPQKLEAFSTNTAPTPKEEDKEDEIFIVVSCRPSSLQTQGRTRETRPRRRDHLPSLFFFGVV